jgi:hypothetical protein
METFESINLKLQQQKELDAQKIRDGVIRQSDLFFLNKQTLISLKVYIKPINGNSTREINDI